MSPRGKTTLADLSRKTGLSQATISMILARRPDVSFSEETVRLVREAAQELGYTPAGNKRLALFSRRTILVVCPLLLNHYYTVVVQAIQSAAAGMGCNTLVHTTYREADEEARILRVLAESDIGGVIFAMMPQSRELIAKVARTTPVVIIADPEPGIGVDLIALHNHRAGELVGRHLIELGHRRVACVSTPLSASIPARARRFEGLRDAWTEGCPEGEVRLFTNVGHARERDNILLERDLGYEIARAVVTDGSGHFTAIVAINDMMAYGVLDALHEAGLRVPEDCSVCGCDDDFPSHFSGVRLTSVEHFMAKKARCAFSALYLKMTGEQAATDIAALDEILPELARRSSTGPASTVRCKNE